MALPTLKTTQDHSGFNFKTHLRVQSPRTSLYDRTSSHDQLFLVRWTRQRANPSILSLKKSYLFLFMNDSVQWCPISENLSIDEKLDLIPSILWTITAITTLGKRSYVSLEQDLSSQLHLKLLGFTILECNWSSTTKLKSSFSDADF